MGKRRGHSNSTAWGIGGVATVGALVLGLAGFALAQTDDAPANAGSVPQLPAAASTESGTAPQRAVFVGDSYTAGTGATNASTTFPQLVAERMGWEVVNLGRGGTSYLATSDQAGCGLDYCPNYLEMIPAVVDADPDIVVVSGGRNDQMSTEVAAQIDRFYTELRATLPDAVIYATSPLGDDDPAPRSLASMGAAIEAAVTKAGGQYLDLGQPLTGRPELITGDGVHPNDDGYALIANTLVPLLPAA
jgi:acyl-CoA thioesterase-1